MNNGKFSLIMKSLSKEERKNILKRIKVLIEYIKSDKTTRRHFRYDRRYRRAMERKHLR
jgi:hypothetical protein